MIAGIWVVSNWLTATGALAAFLVASGVAQAFMPKPTSPFSQERIISSMASRYATYLMVGDAMRADAMKLLLEKAGIPTDPAG
jgi:hypothetical protein